MTILKKDFFIKIVIFTLSVLLTYLLFLLPFIKNSEFKAYDILSSWSASEHERNQVVIVGIDEISFNQFQLQWPWPRSLHARLVNSLNNAGAKDIVFDVVFAEASNDKDDMAFANAISNHPSVLLASDHYRLQTKQFTQELDILPYKLFLESGARYGNAQLPLDIDSILRRIPLKEKSLWAKTLNLKQLELDVLQEKNKFYINYYSMQSIPYASYYQALYPKLLPNKFFKDKIVIIGLHSNISLLNQMQQDSFLTPTFIKEERLIPGVFIHANILSNYLNHDLILSVEPVYISILLFFIILLALFIIWNRSLYVALFITLISIFTIILLSMTLYHYGVWFNFVMIIGNLLVLYLFYWAYAYIKTYQERNFIKVAFKSYLSPEIVEQISANPELLNLKGEKKKVTILFCDLANFTAISEQSSPEEISQTINEYFSRMTHVLYTNKATVDKFIGDAVMAFWGAPLKDDLQAKNAVISALAMLEEFEKFSLKQKFFKKNGVKLRIGIYTGIAMIGNFGSKERLSYTAIGDTVNTASRLEGANKRIDTNILIGEVTYNELSPVLQKEFKPEGEIEVKGKKEKITVFSYKYKN